ncbi:MAG: transcriptional regulator [Epsilonproteobacteria bacterium]|nr:MAG: transcriptional regulator [Campylobacterota bacterium]
MAYKHDYDKALTRLRIILKKLNEGESLSVTHLAEEFGVSTRTIQRDFNEKLTSYPIIQENKKWKMQEGFKIEKINDIEDTIVLNIIEKMTDNIGTNFSAKAKKLLSKIRNEECNPIYTKLDLEDVSDKIDVIKELDIAIKEQNIVTCNYILDKTYNISIKPLKIANYEGFWYLIALDSRDDELKKYYLKNISAVNITDESFEIEEKLETLLDNSISIWFNKNNEPYNVKLFISKEIAKYFKRKPISKTQIIESLHEDGSMEIVIKVTSDMEILPLVKYWLPFIKVLEPQRVDDTIKSELTKYLKDFY